MSIGEIMNLYSSAELNINPNACNAGDRPQGRALTQKREDLDAFV